MQKICQILSCILIFLISTACHNDLKKNAISENQPILSDSISEGKKLFEATCVRCHGMDGSGLTGPSLRRPKLRHAPDLASFTTVVEQGIAGTGMPSNWAITDGDCRQLYAYINSMKEMNKVAPPGNSTAGALVYQHAACANCHMMNGNGKSVGPDLSEISFSRNAAYIRQAIIDPGAALPESTDLDNGYGFSLYLPVKILTWDDKTISGLRVNEDTYTIQFRDQDNNYYSFKKNELKSLEKEYGQSLMPSYANSLSSQEIENLIAFLSKPENQ
ncbi:MAG: c-type cytochrome [Chitinophagales bacterium]